MRASCSPRRYLRCLCVHGLRSWRRTIADRKDWIQLFNGKNLDGWTVKIAGHELGDNFGNTFRVQDGKIAVSYDSTATSMREFGHIFYRGT